MWHFLSRFDSDCSHCRKTQVLSSCPVLCFSYVSVSSSSWCFWYFCLSFFTISWPFSVFWFLAFVCWCTLKALVFFMTLSESFSDLEFLDFSVDVSGVMRFGGFLFSFLLFYLPADFPFSMDSEQWCVWLRPTVVLRVNFSFYRSSYFFSPASRLDSSGRCSSGRCCCSKSRGLGHIWWCSCFLKHHLEWPLFLVSSWLSIDIWYTNEYFPCMWDSQYARPGIVTNTL